jgi:hypothetical protein
MQRKKKCHNKSKKKKRLAPFNIKKTISPVLKRGYMASEKLDLNYWGLLLFSKQALQ